MGVPKGEERENKAESLFKEIMAKRKKLLSRNNISGKRPLQK